MRIYACGGDGTINEVANGIAGSDNAAMTCIPVGTGNDFLKIFGPESRARFSDLAALSRGPQAAMDLIDCNGHLGIDIVCTGLDARIEYVPEHIRRAAFEEHGVGLNGGSPLIPEFDLQPGLGGEDRREFPAQRSALALGAVHILRQPQDQQPHVPGLHFFRDALCRPLHIPAVHRPGVAHQNLPLVGHGQPDAPVAIIDCHHSHASTSKYFRTSAII